ncbi:MAG TPA: MFS transporter, partial [Acidimicrobiales bacterium]|nr:MFS transporter [Acidimicrobiales bacterium]
HALMPLPLFRSRNRSVVYGTVLAVGMAIFSMFYFGTLYMQDILGYSPLKAGLAYLAPSVTIVMTAGVVSRLIARTGAKVFLVAGCAMAALGLFWLTGISVTSTYVGGMLGPLLLTAAGMGISFVPLTTTAVEGVAAHEQGIASALLNSGQQIGGTLGLAVLGSIAVATTRQRLTTLLGTLGGDAPLRRALAAGPAAARGALPPAVHHAVLVATVSGYRTAFAVGAGVFLFAFLLATFGYRPARSGDPLRTPLSASTPALATAAADDPDIDG